MKTLYSIEDIAIEAGASVSRAYKLRACGVLPLGDIQVGHRWYYSEECYLATVEQLRSWPKYKRINNKKEEIK